MTEHLVLDIEYSDLRRQLDRVASPANLERVPEALERLKDLAPTLSNAGLLLELICTVAALTDPQTSWKPCIRAPKEPRSYKPPANAVRPLS